MCIDLQEFENYLCSEFGSGALFFDDSVNFLIQDRANKEFVGVDLPTFSIIRDSFWERFSSFLKVNGYDDCPIFYYNYELLNYFCSYYFGGITSLFKDRSPDWKGPRIYLTRRVCSDSDLKDLPEKITVYRGMCEAEYESSSFGMSWSIDKKVARDFADRNTAAGDKSFVIEANVNLIDVLYFCSTDHEKEIVVRNGLITSGIKA